MNGLKDCKQIWCQAQGQSQGQSRYKVKYLSELLGRAEGHLPQLLSVEVSSTEHNRNAVDVGIIAAQNNQISRISNTL